MPTLTSFLGLSTYDVVTDGSSLFLKYRTDVAGSPSESNLQLLDRFASDLSGSVIDLQDNVKPVYYVAGVASSPNTYEATAVLVEAYTTNMIICLAVDGTITGDTTLDINSFGVKALKKNDIEGNAQQLVSGDLKVGKNYLFRYDGSQWIWVAATSGDQISMSGSSGNLVQISASGVLIDSGSSIANIVATGGAPGAAPYITSASATGLTNYSVITAGSNIVVTTVGGSTVIDSTGGGSGSAYSGVVPIDITGSVISHDVSGIATGSYNAVEVNTFGHIISGSVISYLTDAVISGSDVMSDSSGCIVKHNVSGAVSGSYSKVFVNTTGHVTTGCTLQGDEIPGRLSDSQNINIWDEGVFKGQAYTLNFIGSGVTAAASSGCATITITSSSSGSSGSTVYYGAPPIDVTGSEISHDLSGIASGSYNVVEVNTYGHTIGGSVVSYLTEAVITGSDVMSDTSGCVVKHNISGITAGSYNAIEINALGHAIGGSVVSYLQDTVISGSDVMSDTSGCVVKHNISGITAGSYNAVEINALGHATGGSVVSYLTDVIITGSDVMSGTTGCIVKHNVSGITAGSYNAIEINVLGHAVGGSVVSYLQDVVISGSDVMSGTSGCTVKHNASGVVSGSYTKLFVDNVGHITTGCLVTADEISGRLPDSQYINVFEEGVLQGQVYSLDFLGTSVTASASSGSGTITITASGGSASGAVVSIPVVQAAHGFATGDSIYFDGISWKKAIANSLFSVGTHIAEYVNASNFNAIQAGKLTITSHGLGSDGDWLYTSSLFSGSLVSASSVIGNPLAQIIDENTLFVHDFRASDNGSTNEIGAYIISNAIEDRAYSASSVSINEFADVLATFIGDLNSGSTLSYTITDITEDRTYDANLTTFGELSNVLGTLINDKIAGSSISFTVTNLTTDREYDANSTIINELADIIGNLINDLQEVGKYPAIKIINDNRYVNVSGDTMTGPLTINALLATSQGRTANTARVTTTYNVLVTDEVIFCDTDGGAFTITLPAGIEGQHFKIINCGSAGLDLTVDGDGTEKVYGELTQAIPDESVIDLHYNATEGWW